MRLGPRQPGGMLEVGQRSRPFHHLTSLQLAGLDLAIAVDRWLVRLAGAPAGTKSIAVVVDDASAPITPYVYWVVFDIGPGTSALLEGQLPKGYRWDDLTGKDGVEQLNFYRALLVHLGTKGQGRVLAIFANSSKRLRRIARRTWRGIPGTGADLTKCDA